MEDKTRILESMAYFHSLIQDEVSGGVPADRIVIGGFSQGGAMSILSGLTAPAKIAGIVGLSSWLLLHNTFTDYLPEGRSNMKTPILMGHGDSDPLVLYKLGEASAKMLMDRGCDVTLKTYRYVAQAFAHPVWNPLLANLTRGAWNIPPAWRSWTTWKPSSERGCRQSRRRANDESDEITATECC